MTKAFIIRVGFSVCFTLAFDFVLLGTAVQEQRVSNKTSISISGHVFVLGVPPPEAEVYLLFHDSEKSPMDADKSTVTTAGTIFEKLLCGISRLSFADTKTDLRNEVTHCDPSGLAQGGLGRALTMATYWGRGNPHDPSMCCFLRGPVPLQGNNAPDEVEEARTDGAGSFALKTKLPGHYVIIIRTPVVPFIRPGHETWLQTLYVEMGKTYALGLSRPM